MPRILLVEDDRDARDTTLQLLRALGHWATGVSSAEIALHRYIEGGFDVLITDVGLPGLSGRDLAQKLSCETNLPIIFASGMPVPPTLPPRAVWLAKPYDIEQLKEALEAVADPGGRRQGGASSP